MLVLGEVAQPVARSGVDRIAFRSILEVELKQISSSSVPSRSGRVVVSAALAKFGASPLSYSVSATLRDEKSGTLLAIVSGSAQSIAPPTSELRDAVLTMAAHDALSQIPRALTAYAAR